MPLLVCSRIPLQSMQGVVKGLRVVQLLGGLLPQFCRRSQNSQSYIIVGTTSSRLVSPILVCYHYFFLQNGRLLSVRNIFSACPFITICSMSIEFKEWFKIVLSYIYKSILFWTIKPFKTTFYFWDLRLHTYGTYKSNFCGLHFEFWLM